MFRIIAIAAAAFLLYRKVNAKSTAAYNVIVNPSGLPKSLKLSGTKLNFVQPFTIQNNDLGEDLKYSDIIGNVSYGNRTVGQFQGPGETIPRNSEKIVNINIELQLLQTLFSSITNIANDAKMNVNYVIRVGAVRLPGTTFLTIPNFKGLVKQATGIFQPAPLVTDMIVPPKPIVINSSTPIYPGINLLDAVIVS